MKRLFHFLLCGIPDFVFVSLVLSLFHVKYAGSFEHCREVEQILRIPLWRPYEIVDFRRLWTLAPSFGGVELHDWNMWNVSGCYNARTHEADTDPVQEALKYLTEIKDFTLGDGVFGGVRRILPGPDGRNYPDRYFIFAKGHAEVSYFTDRGEFLLECRKYGIDGTALGDFSENWRIFWRRHDASSGLVKEILDVFHEGFTWGERAYLSFLVLFYSLIVRRRIHRRRVSGAMSD